MGLIVLLANFTYIMGSTLLFLGDASRRGGPGTKRVSVEGASLGIGISVGPLAMVGFEATVKHLT